MSRQPKLPEIIRRSVETGLARVRTSLPGIVKSYDASAGTVEVEIAIEDDIGKTVLSDVPVKFPSGGGYRLVFPLASGDEVSLVFESADTSEFRVTGQTSEAPLNAIGFSCFALPGGSSDSAVLPNAPTDKLLIGKKDASTEIEISDSEIKLDSTATDAVALAPAVEGIKTALNNLATALFADTTGTTPLAPAGAALTSAMASLVPIGATKVKAK